jgi:RNA polymerase sigma factor (sigma-70 family)
MNTDHLEKITDLVNVAAKKIFIKHPKFITYHVFGALEDAEQVGWVRVFESKKMKEIIDSDDIDNNAGLIVTILYRGMVDYIRSVAGREGRNGKASPKQMQILLTTRYMDYYANDEGDDYDLPIPCPKNSESQIVGDILAKEIEEFMNKKLSRRDKMIMDYLFKEGMTGKEIGKKFAVTESRIAQIKEKAVKQLSGAFNG